ncbi:MAG: colanic acid biosynthesis acetyltransferase WcaF [Flavobacteriales bacterium]|nr:colanic acid biosynthesis acetyltransferase WcaF [Flavobacteriales bacterium]
MNKTTDLSRFDNSHYTAGGVLKRWSWYLISHIFFMHGLMPFMGPKRFILRMFGARLGRGLIIKPRVNIKYPWLLEIGDHVWIGEEVWIDNLDQVKLGDHTCLSQGALLLCGNHDYKKSTFDLITRPISIAQGAWIGARSTVVGGVSVAEHAVLSVGSVATSDLEAYMIYQGNPARPMRKREIH